MQQTGRVREKLRIDIGFGGAKVVGDWGTVSLEKSDILIGVGSGEKEREGTEETIIDDAFKDCFCKGEQRNPV